MKDLLDYLEDLRQCLDKAGIERTAGLKAAMGKDCAFYTKSKNIVLDQHWDKIKTEFLKSLEEFRKVEGNEFGR